MKAKLDGTAVLLNSDGCALYEKSGYGRPVHGGLCLSPEEACYLLHRNRIEVEGFNFEGLLAHFSEVPGFLRRFLVYRDLRERGYAVQTGPHDFRIFRKGQRPGTGESRYMLRVLSERDLVVFETLIGEVQASLRMRKPYILAIVDDESELTYYEVKVQNLQEQEKLSFPPHIEGILVGNSAVIRPPHLVRDKMPSLGMNLDGDRAILSPLEIIHLMADGLLTLRKSDQEIGLEQFLEKVAGQDHEFVPKASVYRDLRKRGYIPRTGYKFGHHFRVYTGKKLHSELLVHAITSEHLPMSSISRSVRLANSVKKKMLFALQNSTEIQYLEFSWIKL